MTEQARKVLRQAASVQGWDGVVVDDMTLLGLRVAVVAAVDPHVHAARQATGWGPVTDRMTLAMWEDWPEQYPDVPPSAVRLVGFLAHRKRWQHALSTAGGFVGFGSTAVLLDGRRPPSQNCTMTCHYYGVGVAWCDPSSGDVELVQAGRVGPVPTARPTAISRWAEEVVYQEILDRGLVAAEVGQ